MKRLLSFIKTSLLGGVAVLLPILLTYYLLQWVFQVGINMIHPLTRILIERVSMPRRLADALAIALIVGICFATGLLIKTRFGGFLFSRLEKYILKVAPGYSLFKETLKQFLGQKKRPFSAVVLGRVFGGRTMMTGFITDEQPGGRVTVFFPSALNPTTGLLCHLEERDVIRLDVSFEEAMRTIISCGSGSAQLLEKMEGE